MQKISQEGPDVIRIPELKGALFDVVYDVGIVGSFGFLRLVTTFIDGLFPDQVTPNKRLSNCLCVTSEFLKFSTGSRERPDRQ